jgi:hypothetical protein
VKSLKNDVGKDISLGVWRYNKGWTGDFNGRITMMLDILDCERSGQSLRCCQ